jgi:hypothetical protein
MHNVKTCKSINIDKKKKRRNYSHEGVFDEWITVRLIYLINEIVFYIYPLIK